MSLHNYHPNWNWEGKLDISVSFVDKTIKYEPVIFMLNIINLHYNKRAWKQEAGVEASLLHSGQTSSWSSKVASRIISINLL
jgi:hypothetical protein